MGNRGQKRAETVEDLPADKRACNSMEFRPSTSNSSVQTHMNSTNSTAETNDHDMDTSSSASASSRSEGEPEKDSAYGSCDSDDAEQRHSDLRDYHRRRSSGDHGKFKRILSSLSEETEDSGQLAVLTELCELLSFCTENSLSSLMSDSLAPHLVKLARHETNPDIMLLAIRAITYLCDVFPRASAFLVRHDGIPALCQRLMAIEYLDVAEQVSLMLYLCVCCPVNLVHYTFCSRKESYYVGSYDIAYLNVVSASIGENISGTTTCMLAGWCNNGCPEFYRLLLNKHTGNIVPNIFMSFGKFGVTFTAVLFQYCIITQCLNLVVLVFLEV